MITFHLRECAIPFFQHTLVIPAQDITFNENTKGYKYLQFEGCEHVDLRLVSIGLKCSDKDTFEYYVETGRVQVRPFYDQITVEIVNKQDSYAAFTHQQVYYTFTHRQDITSDTRGLQTVY